MSDQEKSKEEIWKAFFEDERKIGKDSFHLSHRPTEILPRKLDKSDDSKEFTVAPKQNKIVSSVETSSDQETVGKDFVLENKIGQGGMGSIFKGKQLSLQRDVAIKILHKNNSDPQLFISEAHVTGGLEHGNIVPIHHFGFTADGTPHLAMKLVKGKSWLDILKTENRSLREHLRILISVCNAISYAHKHEIIHRDIKLENIMVGEFGEIFVMDWGIAASFAKEKSDTVLHVSSFETPCGTPVYMAPELAMGEGDRQGPWTDIYLLGACLHHCMTKNFRHNGSTMGEILNSALQSSRFPYPKSVPSELAKICNKAMHKEPEERFKTVKEFQDSLEKFLEHEQANALISESLDKLELLETTIAEYATTKKEDIARKINRLDGEIVFGFEQALKIWSDAKEAEQGLLRENAMMLEHALQTEDLGFAQYLMSRREISEYHSKIEQLRKRTESQKKELVHLRETARGHDWKEVTSPLGTIFLLAAILGSLGCFFTGSTLRHSTFDYWLILPMWAIIGSILIVVSYFQFRDIKIKSMVSEDIIGMWFVVGIATVFAGVINHFLGLPPFRMISVASLLIGIGIANMALDIQKWLFIPSIVFFIGAIFMAVAADYGLEIFGFLWLVSLMTIGVYFKVKSFSLEEEEERFVDIKNAEYNPSGGFITFILLFFGYLCYYLTRSNLSIAQLSMIKLDVLSTANITSITSWGIVFYAIGKFTNGMITDIIGGKSIFILGMIGSIFSTCMFATGENYYWFLFWWCCNFYFLSMGWSGLIKICSHWYGASKQRGTIMGLISFSYQMGEAIAKIFTTFLTSFALLVWQGLFFLPAAILAAAAIIVFVFLKEQPTNKGVFRETPNIRMVLRTLFSSRSFLLLIWAAFALTMVRGFFQSYTPLLLAGRGLEIKDAGYTSSLFPIAGMVGTFIAGWFSDKMLGNRSSVLIIPSIILAFLLFSNQLFAKTVMLQHIFLILGGFLIYSSYSILAGVAAIDIGGNQAPATTAGILDGFGYLGYAGGSFLLLYYTPDQLISVFAGLTLLMSLSLLPLLKIYPTEPLNFAQEQ